MEIFNKLYKKSIMVTGSLSRFMVVWIAIMLSPSFGWGDPAGDRKTIIKAGFVYNFTKFVQWPDETMGRKDSEDFNLCVMGQNAIESILSRLGESRRIKSKRVKIINGLRLDELEMCQILYINDSEHHQIDRIVGRVRGKPVLTISSGKDSAAKGVAIAFVVIENKMRFVVNKKTLEENKLTVSSELLDLAIDIYH